MTVLVWFRQDLRIHDHPALIEALATQQKVRGLFILEPEISLGGAVRWWLHHSLLELRHQLAALNIPLDLRVGSARDVFEDLLRDPHYAPIEGIFWNRRYDPVGVAIDFSLKNGLSEQGVHVTSSNSHLLFEPWTVATKEHHPFQVFTPFWKKCLSETPPPLPLPVPSPSPFAFAEEEECTLFSQSLQTFALLPTTPDWAGGLREMWKPGEKVALSRWRLFFESALQGYKENRDFPAQQSVSQLSPYLRWGEISPRLLYHETAARMDQDPGCQGGGRHFLSELGWREFSYHLLFHFPHLPYHPLRTKFGAFPWEDDPENETRWTQGKTGYPIVDAGMRQLWKTGWIHNRVRMIVASFLVKDLLIPWQKGAEWFLDTLVDADLASNSASWQWVAGCGADAAPYFRIFNPTLQGEKFDPLGHYVKTFVPELSALSSQWIHKPWSAPADVLRHAGIVLGQTYPFPCVDHAKARDRALSLFDTL